jgi:predicted MPP superfamily phosphohydrolase
MIRILYMSDLHLEMERLRLSIPGWADFLRRRGTIARHPPHGPLLTDLGGKIDLVILAGDIHKGLRGIIYAEEVAAYLDAPVVYVAGNHEYYYHDIATLLPSFRKVNAKTNNQVQFLENAVASFTFAGRRVHILGATLWTDYAINGDANAGMLAALRRMNDHRAIYIGHEPLTPIHAARLHAQSLAWLRETLAQLEAEDPKSQKIIVTHHAPDAAFLGARIGPIAPAYASNILPYFKNPKPNLWIHGHTHYRHQTTLENLTLVSAPRGYVTHDGPPALTFRPGIAEL